jgi:hypothetical protein
VHAGALGGINLNRQKTKSRQMPAFFDPTIF